MNTSLSTYRLATIFVLLGLLDCFLTIPIVATTGLESEKAPIAKFMMEHWGNYGLIWFKLIATSFFAFILYWWDKKRILVVCNWLKILIVANNLFWVIWLYNVEGSLKWIIQA